MRLHARLHSSRSGQVVRGALRSRKSRSDGLRDAGIDEPLDCTLDRPLVHANSRDLDVKCAELLRFLSAGNSLGSCGTLYACARARLKGKHVVDTLMYRLTLLGIPTQVSSSPRKRGAETSRADEILCSRHDPTKDAGRHRAKSAICELRWPLE